MKLTNKRKNSYLKYFGEEYHNQNLIAGVDLGFRVVEIDKIVGSVSRYMDFDANFKPKMNHSQERFQLVREALEKDIILPPVTLYKIKDEYYVVDGHHRVSMARQLGQKYVDAYVTEYLPVEDTPENALYRARFDFEQKTGIEGILLSRKEGYDKLAQQIGEHQSYLNEKNSQKTSLKETANDWFYSVYQPIVEKIKEEKLGEQFKNATAG
ncbi:MAG: ParB/RepB/Spo0J family partition protein, partial [Candidatus Aerophobetes bacterium]|nr:ParB/RepB/Spo0J family partition protein [Candidatus Aerophobetes bacterium]